MTVSSIWHGRRLIVMLRGDIDMATAPGMLAAIDQLISAQTPDRLIVSVAHVPFMDVSGRALLAELLRAGEGAGFAVVLVGMSQNQRRLLDVAAMSSRFTYEQ